MEMICLKCGKIFEVKISIDYCDSCLEDAPKQTEGDTP